jgi:hypothetical protein
VPSVVVVLSVVVPVVPVVVPVVPVVVTVVTVVESYWPVLGEAEASAAAKPRTARPRTMLTSESLTRSFMST